MIDKLMKFINLHKTIDILIVRWYNIDKLNFSNILNNKAVGTIYCFFVSLH